MAFGWASDRIIQTEKWRPITLQFLNKLAKPIAQNLWFYDDVIEHWDQLVLRSFAHETGGRTLYQEGPVTTMLPPKNLLAVICQKPVI